jgi:hypothetical protein
MDPIHLKIRDHPVDVVGDEKPVGSPGVEHV